MLARMEESCQKGFFNQVYEVVACVPKGMVVSYGQIAAILGSPRSARVVGWAMRVCPEHLPWQRVVKADGTITGGGWTDLRHQLLVDEGVLFLLDGRVDMKACNWKPGDQAPGKFKEQT